MSELWFILFGESGILKSRSKASAIVKIFYLVCLLPTVLFAMLASFNYGLGSAKDKPGLAKKILVHICSVLLSFVLWKLISFAIDDYLLLKV